LFERAGGLREKLKPKITKKTNFLIMGEQDLDKLNGKDESEKITKAKKYLEKGQDIELLGEDDFLRMVQHLPITEAEQENLITEVMQDNLKKITSINGFTFILDDTSSDRDKRQGIYRGDNILLSRRKTLDPITPLFAQDAQTVRHENVSEITAPNDIERAIFQALKAGQDLTDEHKEFIKSNYVK
jgi:isopentenyl phosphate kinase